MPRRRSPEKIKVLTDPKYKDIIVAKFMNNLMKDGKKAIAEKIVYGAFDRITSQSKEEPIEIFMTSLKLNHLIQMSLPSHQMILKQL